MPSMTKPSVAQPEGEGPLLAGPARATLWRHWVLATGAGEVLGFCAPALAGVWVADTALPAAAGVLVAAGAVEGAVLGIAQGTVVRRAIPGLPARHWALATAVGAAVAWLAAMSFILLVDAAVPWPVLAPLAAMLGTLLLLSIGVAQWWLLRVRVRAAGRWIAVTAAAWLAALAAFTLVTTPLWQPGQPEALTAAIGVLGGFVMASIMALITGWAFVRIADPANAPSSRGHGR